MGLDGGRDVWGGDVEAKGGVGEGWKQAEEHTREHAMF